MGAAASDMADGIRIYVIGFSSVSRSNISGIFGHIAEGRACGGYTCKLKACTHRMAQGRDHSGASWTSYRTVTDIQMDI